MNWKSATLQDYMVSCWNLLDTYIYIHGLVYLLKLMKGRGGRRRRGIISPDGWSWWIEFQPMTPAALEESSIASIQWNGNRFVEAGRSFPGGEKETCFLDMVIFHRSTSSRSTITMLSWGAQTQVALGALLSYRFLNKTNPCLFKLQRVPSQMVIGSE